MQIRENILLAPYTTFKIGGPAKFFCEVKDQFDALTAFEFAREKNLAVFLLGGGSNVVISDEGFKGLVIRVVNNGIEVIENNNQSLLLRVASGENWDGVVEFAVKNNWWGVENLSHIPGSTGAIAVQNVGAYGQEAKNLIESVTVFDTQTHQILNLANADCNFAYRSSIFNTTEKGRYIIFFITFKLSKIPKPILSYRDLFQRFAVQPSSPGPSVTSSGSSDEERIKVRSNATDYPSLDNIRKAIIEIRDKKFPFPTEAKKGNAGSFFKNPILSMAEYEQLEATVAIDFGDEALERLRAKLISQGVDQIKIPSAFLIELCGLKSLNNGGAAINANQPLVIINKTGTATAKEVLELAKTVKETVLAKLQVNIHIEPELIGFSKDELDDIMDL